MKISEQPFIMNAGFWRLRALYSLETLESETDAKDKESEDREAVEESHR